MAGSPPNLDRPSQRVPVSHIYGCHELFPAINEDEMDSTSRDLHRFPEFFGRLQFGMAATGDERLLHGSAEHVELEICLSGCGHEPKRSLNPLVERPARLLQSGFKERFGSWPHPERHIS